MAQGVREVSGLAGPARATISTEALFVRHFDDVYRMVAHLLGPGASEADVEDVTQRVFVAAHRGQHRFRGDAQPTTWLYGIATRVVLNQLRSWRRHRRLVGALEAEMQGASPSPEGRVQAAQELARVWRCLMRVSPKKRVVYVLSVIEERPGPQIAEMLDIPVATVWTRLHHAKKDLAAALERDEKRSPA